MPKEFAYSFGPCKCKWSNRARACHKCEEVSDYLSQITHFARKAKNVSLFTCFWQQRIAEPALNKREGLAGARLSFRWREGTWTQTTRQHGQRASTGQHGPTWEHGPNLKPPALRANTGQHGPTSQHGQYRPTQANTGQHGQYGPIHIPQYRNRFLSTEIVSSVQK